MSEFPKTMHPFVGHPSHWRWDRTATSLALAQRYSALAPQQRAIHDAYSATQDCPSALYDVLPAQTRAAVDEVRRRAAWKTSIPVDVESIEVQAARIAEVGVQEWPPDDDFSFVQHVHTYRAHGECCAGQFCVNDPCPDDLHGPAEEQAPSHRHFVHVEKKRE